ncbi:MAG: LacI family DNA-binding transcriptional regulator [Casimicrobium sp.]|jgi:LacI family gluconate utilization system Gnt-I transcriptional repressor
MSDDNSSNSITTRRKTGRAQMADVARIAGVSTSTVSRTLSNPTSVSKTLRAQVDAAIEQLGYVPNVMAGGLATSRTRTICVIVPSLSNSFFSATIEAMAARFESEGYQIMLGNSDYSLEREEAIINSFLSWSPAAIVLTGQSHSRSALKRLLGAEVPIVEMWEMGDNPIDTLVGFSHRAVGRAAAQHLLTRGKTKIACIGAALDRDRRAAQRCDGFAEVIRETTSRAAIIAGPKGRANIEQGMNALEALIVAHPDVDGVFFSNDALMLGGLFHCQRQGIRIPQDLALIGFGDLDFAAHSLPSLSTIRPPKAEIGAATAEHLLRRFSNEDVPPETIDLGFELIARGSS